MDVVYLWVNGEDPARIQRFRRYKAEAEGKSIEDVGVHRFSDHGELKYSLRALEQFAPWTDRIFLVTDGQHPAWIKKEHPSLVLVNEGSLFPNQKHLPTFNSVAVDAHLHRIPTLSRKFLYFNDDFFVGAPLAPTDFFTAAGATVFYQGSLGFRGEAQILDFSQDPNGRLLGPQDHQQLLKEIGSWVPSLRNGAVLLDQEYEPAVRRSVAHSPFLIDVEWMNEAQKRWETDFERTSSHRFRCNEDVHVQFLYYNYLVAEGARSHRFKVDPIYARADPKLYDSLHVGAEADTVHQFFDRPQLPKFFHIASLASMTPESTTALQARLERAFPKKSRFEK